MINTHAIVLRNAGSMECTNVRVLHWVLPEFSVYPPMNYTTSALPMGQTEIVFDRLVPKQQVTINYLYFPPLLWNQVHAGVQHDAGFAEQKTVVPTPVVPTWLRNTLVVLMILGLIFLIYLGYEAWLHIFANAST